MLPPTGRQMAWAVDAASGSIAGCSEGTRNLLMTLMSEAELENATRRGFVHYPYLSTSRTFRYLRDAPGFQDLLTRVKATWEEMQRLA